MTDPAAPRHRMTVEEFLAWAETQEEPYELEDGVPVPLWPRDPGEPTMMASPTVGHQQVQLNALGILQRRLQYPCWAIAGVAVAIRSRRTRVPDIVASCVPADSRSNLVGAPVLIVEVLSPTSEAKDRSRKLDEYKELVSVQEILAGGQQSKVGSKLASRGERLARHRRDRPWRLQQPCARVGRGSGRALCRRPAPGGA